MAVIQVHKSEGYTVMSNCHLREKGLSLKSKGLLSVMLSLPDDWEYSLKGLVSICKENESAVKSTLKELQEFGYLVLEKMMPNQTKSGRIEYVYHIFESPQKDEGEEKQEGKKQEVEIQPLEIQPLEIQPVENQPQLNTNILNTNILNINIYRAILDFLNEKAGTSFRANGESHRRKIDARLKEGFKQEDFFKVIEKKCTQWKGTEFAKYLRPETLFGPKFESYLNEPSPPPPRIKGAAGVEIDPTAEDDLAGIL